MDIDPDFLESVETVLFVCYGNICRSPFCEHYWRNLGASIRTDSAGFITTEGRKTPPEYRAYAAEHGVDLSLHSSKWVSPELVNDADLIVLMDSSNAREFKALYPESLERAVLLGAFLDPAISEIEDPFHLGAEAARAIYQQMAEAVSALYERLT